MVDDFEMSKKEYIYHLNAFVNSARNVTLVMQKEYAHAEGFDDWYEGIRAATPEEFREFIQIRNISIKEKSIEPYLLTGQFDLGVTLPPKSSAKIAITLNHEKKEVEIKVVYSNGKTEVSTKPLLMDFLIYEAANKKHKEVVINDFIKVSQLYIRFLEMIVSDCAIKFGASSV
jgi:hypothetical protein